MPTTVQPSKSALSRACCLLETVSSSGLDGLLQTAAGFKGLEDQSIWCSSSQLGESARESARNIFPVSSSQNQTKACIKPYARCVLITVDMYEIEMELRL